jgi:hypothetical protein
VNILCSQLRVLLALVVVLVCWLPANLWANKIAVGSGVIANSYLQGILAKELCSCTYVTRPGLPTATDTERLQSCFQRANLPLSPSLINLLMNTGNNEGPSEKEITSSPKFLGALLGLFQGHSAIAIFEGPEKGCRLIDTHKN